jgi:NADPH-dependent glutamate synthase beta subunit-like oxidoreductase
MNEPLGLGIEEPPPPAELMTCCEVAEVHGEHSLESVTIANRDTRALRDALETSQPGVFAVGDVHSGSIKRVASAVGEGSMAVKLIHQRLATPV